MLAEPLPHSQSVLCPPPNSPHEGEICTSSGLLGALGQALSGPGPGALRAQIAGAQL